MDVEHLRAAINTVFGGKPVPKIDALIDGIYIDNTPRAEELRHELSGRTWQSLTQEFLKKWCNWLYYLGTEAYLYYLPAFLIGALADYDSDMELCHSVIHIFEPNFLALYYDGKDEDHHIFASALTDQQYVIISEFLGLVFEKAPNWNYCAARTLYWGWNRISTRESQIVIRYYREMRSFLRPKPDDPQIADLCREIDSAFAETPYPGDDRLCEDLRDPDPALLALELRGVKWQNTHPALLSQCHSALSFLPRDAFRYFLPGYLIADLCSDESNANPVFHLTNGLYDSRADRIDSNPDMEWRDHIISRLAPFNHRERLAIIHYLKNRERLDQFDSTQILQALDRYWRPSLGLGG